MFFGSVAHADPPASPDPAAASVFRDWRLDCAATCTASTRIRGADGSIVFTLSAAAGRLVLRTRLPLHLPGGLLLALPETEPRMLAWRTCDRGGCEAEIPLEPALLDELRRAPALDLGLTLEDGIRIRLSASLLGFTAAHAALSERAVRP